MSTGRGVELVRSTTGLQLPGELLVLCEVVIVLPHEQVNRRQIPSKLREVECGAVRVCQVLIPAEDARQVVLVGREVAREAPDGPVLGRVLQSEVHGPVPAFGVAGYRPAAFGLDGSVARIYLIYHVPGGV